MAEYNASITFSLNDKLSPGLKTISGNLNILDTQAKKGKKTFGDYWKAFNNGAANTQTAANLSLAAQSVGQLASSVQRATAAPTNLARAFQSGMARISTVLTETNATEGNTTTSMHSIEKAAAAMAGGVSTAGKIASIGMDKFTNSTYTMLSSGLNVKQAIAATEQSALLAKATGGSLSDASAALTGVFNNLGNKDAKNAQQEMTRLSDVIAGTQNYFAFENLQQFTSGLKNVSGAAVANKVPLIQLSVAIGQLNTNMIIGPEAGTALKTTLAQLSNASKKLGFEVARTANGGVDLVQSLKNIATQGYSADAITKGFGTEAGPAVALLTENIDALDAGFNAANTSAGTTLSNATKMANTFASKQQRLNDTWAVFGQRIGLGSMGVKSFGASIGIATGKVVNLLTSIPILGNTLASVTGGFMQVSGGILSFVSSSFQFTAGINSMIALGSKMPAMLGMLKTGMLWVKGSILNTIPTMATWIASVWSAAAAHIAAAWPIYAIIGAIAALTAVVLLTIKHWSTLTIWLKTAWQWFSNLLNNPLIATAGLIFAPFITIPALIVKHWQPIKAFFVGLWNGIVDGIISFIDSIHSAITSVLELLEPLFGIFDKLFGGTPHATAQIPTLEAPEQATLAVGTPRRQKARQTRFAALLCYGEIHIASL